VFVVIAVIIVVYAAVVGLFTVVVVAVVGIPAFVVAIVVDDVAIKILATSLALGS
jgi:hypothetical protein